MNPAENYSMIPVYVCLNCHGEEGRDCPSCDGFGYVNSYATSPPETGETVERTKDSDAQPQAR